MPVTRGAKVSRFTEMLQAGKCTSGDWLTGSLRVDKICVACQTQELDDSDDCRFEGFRQLIHTSTGVLETRGFKSSSCDAVTFRYDISFNADIEIHELQHLKHAVALALLPMLNEELQALKGNNIIFKDRERDSLALCDICYTSFLFVSFFCEGCGLEVCVKCFNAKQVPSRTSSCRHKMRICSRQQREPIAATITKVTEYLREPYIPAAVTRTAAASSQILGLEMNRRVPRLGFGQVLAFRDLWTLRVPIVVDLKDRFRGLWQPDALSDLYGNEQMTMLEVKKSGETEEHETTLSQFFQEFQQLSVDDTRSIKAKNWPPSEHIQQTCPIEYRDFCAMLPFPAFTGPNGAYNAPSHFARDRTDCKSHAPDLGPKMYIATADRQKLGTTNLHLDVTSAVNILVDTDVSEGEGGAEWIIFCHQDASKLRDYLRKTYGADEDPVLSQEYYISHDDLRCLASIDVRPLRFSQRLGEAVLIPAGCPHQVSNLGKCIKVAADFLDAISIPESARLAESFRIRKQPDVLKLKHTLWHAWHSIMDLESAPSLKLRMDTRRHRHNVKQKSTIAARNDKSRREDQKLIASGKVTQEQLNASRVVYCPHVDCIGWIRCFAVKNLYVHIESYHGLDLTDAEKIALEALSYEQWPDLFHSFVQKRTLLQ